MTSHEMLLVTKPHWSYNTQDPIMQIFPNFFYSINLSLDKVYNTNNIFLDCISVSLIQIYTVKIMILSRYRYCPVTVFLVIVTHRDPSFHHRDTPVPNRPSPSLTVLHRPSHRPLTVPHRPSPSNTVPRPPTPFKTTF
jgi:hypothetical protein